MELTLCRIMSLFLDVVGVKFHVSAKVKSTHLYIIYTYLYID